MKIQKIQIKNYRSIKELDIDVESFNVFVGQNNHGKTNLFEAIEWFFNAKSTSDEEYFNKETSNTIRVEVYFSNVEDTDINKLKSHASKTKITSLLEGQTSFSVVKTSDDHKRTYVVNGENKNNPQGLDTAINEFLPKLEYVNTKIRLDDVSKYKDKNPIGQMLSGVLSVIIENSKDYIAFKMQFSKLFDHEESDVRKELDELGGKVEVYLKKQFPDGTTVRFSVNPPNFNDLLKSFDTVVDDGIETKAEAKGDGMQRAIMLSIIQAFADYRKSQLGGGTFLFLIDEAELHLHPSAQRALKKALLDICETDQVFVNTHSSVLVVEDVDLQKIFCVEKNNGITKVSEVDEIDKANLIFDLLGGSPSDLLLPRNFLIVEGKSEFEFLTRIVKRFYASEFTGIKILFAGGDIDEQERSLHAVDKLFRPLAGNSNPIYKEKTIILLDRPNNNQQAKYKQFLDGYPYLNKNKQVFMLSTETLEEYYPDQYKKNRGELPNDQKVEYAKSVAESVTKEEFESQMSTMHQVILTCIDKAFPQN